MCPNQNATQVLPNNWKFIPRLCPFADVRRHSAVALAGLALAGLVVGSGLVWPVGAASVRQDANGFVVLEAEDFDLNRTRDNGAWLFDNDTAPLWAPFTGWGYMKAFGTGGTNLNISPRLDFSVKFDMTGPHYVWVLGSDAGAKSLHLGLNGAVTTNTWDIGGEDGAFGPRNGGEWLWVGTNNTGTAQKWINKSYVNVPSAVDHTVNVFIYGAGLWVDKIVFTTNINWRPEPFNVSPGGIPNSGATNIPTPRIVGSPLLGVAMTQPAHGDVFTSASNLVVLLSAKAVTNGQYHVTKMEFFARQQPSGTTTKVGEKLGSPPWMIGWSNPPVGIHELTAKVTDSGNRVRTSAVVTVEIKPPVTYLTPLVWVTNRFDTDLGRWTLAVDNHASGFITNLSEGWVFNWYFDLDWRNTALAGGTPGEFGGHIARMASVAPYVAEPLPRRVSLNEELWFRGRGYYRNYGPNRPTPPATNRIDANSDCFIGYFDSAVYGQPSRIGLKSREPSNTYPNPSPWRMALANKGGFEDYQLGAIVPETNAFTFELRWTPSGNGDGSGTLSGTVAGVNFSANYGPNPATYDAFGFVAVAQGSNEPWRQQDQYYDNLEYLVPVAQTLDIRLLSSTATLLSWAVPGHILQVAEGNLPTSRTNAAWTDIATNLYANVGGRFYYTNPIGPVTRWFQLRLP